MALLASSIYSSKYLTTRTHTRRLLQMPSSMVSIAEQATECIVCGILDQSLDDARLDSEPHDAGAPTDRSAGRWIFTSSQSEHWTEMRRVKHDCFSTQSR